MIRFFIAAFLFTGSLHAVTVIQQGNTAGRIGEGFGKGFSEGFSKSMEESRRIEQDRQLREQLQTEHRIVTEMSYYNNIVSQLSCESAHPTLTLSQGSMQPFTHKSYIEMNDNRTMGCEFKLKLNRVLSEGTLVEWLWSLDISNETKKKFLSFGSMEYPKARFKIELLDANNFAISSCVYYADVFLKREEKVTLQGKWMISYDQVSHLSGYQINIGYP